MLLNAEGLPIEGIDKITVMLNPSAAYFLTTERPYTDNTHYIRLDQIFYFGIWPFLTIQSQRIDHTLDIRYSIAKAIYELIEKKILVFPIDISLLFIYMNLGCFVYNIKEIEFYFDFKKDNIHILHPELLNQIGTSYYSSDYRSSKNSHTRKSFLEVYDHAKNLERLNQTSRKN